MKILLASQSPRRSELLTSLGYTFDVVKINCEELLPIDIKVEDAAAYLSALKADAYGSIQNNNEVLLTADTIVAIGNTILGKPKNEAEAKEMLKTLSGKTHQVYTAFTVKTKNSAITKTDVAEVEFDHISENEIDYYIQNFRPYDKAGSYGIQEWLGMSKTKNLNGSYYTIMGLPTHLVYNTLTEMMV